MSEKTLAEEIITIVKAHSNDNPAPKTCTILKTYTDGYVDAITPDDEYYRYVECYGDNTIGTKGVIIFIDGDENQQKIITDDAPIDLTDYIKKSTTTGLIKNDGSIDTNTYSTFSGSYTDLTNKPNIPSKTSDLTNDSDFISTSNTAGLIKNDGTIDTTSYSTATHTHDWEVKASSTEFPTKYSLYVNPAIHMAELIIQHKDPNSYSGTTNIGLNVGASYVPLGIAIRMTNKENIRIGVATTGDVYIYGTVEANTNVQGSLMWHY